MPKKEKKKARAGKKPDKKELERRIEEEQKKLLKKKKLIEKRRKKVEKKEKELSDKVEIKKKSEDKEESVHKEIDYQRFLEQQQIKLDYAAMFSYLGNLKKPEYTYGGGAPEIIKIIYKKNETITWEEIKQVTDEEKMNMMMGLNRNFEINERREGYQWWKAFNKGLGEFLYQISMT